MAPVRGSGSGEVGQRRALRECSGQHDVSVALLDNASADD